MPRTFTDEEGREWRLKIHVPVRNRIFEDLEIDLFDVDDGRLMQRLIGHPADLAAVLWMLCEQQAAEKNIEPEAFSAGLCGDVIDAAIDCLIQALCDFFPPSKRAVMLAALEKIRQTERRAQAESLKALESPELQQLLDDAVGRISSTFTASADKSGSTPAVAKSATAS